MDVIDWNDPVVTSGVIIVLALGVAGGVVSVYLRRKIEQEEARAKFLHDLTTEEERRRDRAKSSRYMSSSPSPSSSSSSPKPLPRRKDRSRETNASSASALRSTSRTSTPTPTFREEDFFFLDDEPVVELEVWEEITQGRKKKKSKKNASTPSPNESPAATPSPPTQQQQQPHPHSHHHQQQQQPQQQPPPQPSVAVDTPAATHAVVVNTVVDVSAKTEKPLNAAKPPTTQMKGRNDEDGFARSTSAAPTPVAEKRALVKPMANSSATSIPASSAPAVGSTTTTAATTAVAAVTPSSTVAVSENRATTRAMSKTEEDEYKDKIQRLGQMLTTAVENSNKYKRDFARLQELKDGLEKEIKSKEAVHTEILKKKEMEWELKWKEVKAQLAAAMASPPQESSPKQKPDDEKQQQQQQRQHKEEIANLTAKLEECQTELSNYRSRSSEEKQQLLRELTNVKGEVEEMRANMARIQKKYEELANPKASPKEKPDVHSTPAAAPKRAKGTEQPHTNGNMMLAGSPATPAHHRPTQSFEETTNGDAEETKVAALINGGGTAKQAPITQEPPREAREEAPRQAREEAPRTEGKTLDPEIAAIQQEARDFVTRSISKILSNQDFGGI